MRREIISGLYTAKDEGKLQYLFKFSSPKVISQSNLPVIPMHKSQMLINGELIASLSGKVEIIRNPANQEPVAEVSVGSREDAAWPLRRAKRAFRVGWTPALCVPICFTKPPALFENAQKISPGCSQWRWESP
jgi:hypothetical protein